MNLYESIRTNIKTESDSKEERIKWLEDALVSVYSYGIRACIIDNIVPGLTNKDSYASLSEEYKKLTGKDFNIKEHIKNESELKESYDTINVIEEVQSDLENLISNLENNGDTVQTSIVIDALKSILKDIEMNSEEAW